MKARGDADHELAAFAAAKRAGLDVTPTPAEVRRREELDQALDAYLSATIAGGCDCAPGLCAGHPTDGEDGPEGRTRGEKAPRGLTLDSDTGAPPEAFLEVLPLARWASRSGGGFAQDGRLIVYLPEAILRAVERRDDIAQIRAVYDLRRIFAWAPPGVAVIFNPGESAALAAERARESLREWGESLEGVADAFRKCANESLPADAAADRPQFTRLQAQDGRFYYRDAYSGEPRNRADRRNRAAKRKGYR